MTTIKEEIIKNAIKFELSMSKLYSCFQEHFTEDAEFWKSLSEEEKSHAQIIMKFKPFLKMDKSVSDEFLSLSKENLQSNIELINSYIKDFNSEIKRIDAFKIAIDLETKSCEEHYRTLLNEETNSDVKRVFQSLNGEDKKHYQKIIDYMNAVHIKI